MRNYKFFWKMISKAECPERLKDEICLMVSKQRTDSLRELTDREFLEALVAASKHRQVEAVSNVGLKIKKLFRLTDEQYSNYVFEWSYVFLEKTISNQQTRDEYSLSAGYWAWWKNQFELADGRFMSLYVAFSWHLKDQNELFEKYKAIHTGIKAVPGQLINRIDVNLKKAVK